MESTYKPLEAEKAAQELWQLHNVYSTKNNPGPLFSIDTPPPTVSGALHIGHVFSYTQADILARYKRMAGFSVFYPFGFDDNGLPTERFVEKKAGVSALQIGRSAFIQLCLNETTQAEKIFEDLWRRIGLSIDWSKCYSTISASTRKISQKSFIELYKKGYIYRKQEPAPYCTVCRTSVAQAELEDAERHSFMNEIAFSPSPSSAAHPQCLFVATTRPELLASCVAVLYNPADARYQHLKDTTIYTPLYNVAVPVLEDERVIIDKGTGLVMCCTFGDKTDVEWTKTFDLPYKPSIGRDGRMTEQANVPIADTPALAGKKVAEARQLIIELLKQEGLLRVQHPVTHMVNVHERCKHEIEYFSLPQWFLKILEYKDTFLEMGNKITWHPAHMKSRYIHWVENIQWDWCLSRQRFYGIPFPVWYCGNCDSILLAEEKELPVDPQETTSARLCSSCGDQQSCIPDTDVMDTWNTSSLTPYLCKELYGSEQGESFLPMSMRPQAHDIIRTWAFYTIVKTWMHDRQIPWETIAISGHVQTSQGEKISKSQSNSPLVPENLLKLYPADVIRYWTASAALGSDISFSDTQLKIGQRLLIKLWNAFRFIDEHAQKNAGEASKIDAEHYDLIDKWILKRLADTMERYEHSFNNYEFHLALEAAERFFWNDVCDNYLELIKDRLFNPGSYKAEVVASTKATLAHMGMRILQLFAPFMPHITETLYGLIFKENYAVTSLHQTRFSLLEQPRVSLEEIAAIEPILEIINQVRKLKSDQHISLKTDLALLHIQVSAQKLTTIQSLLAPHAQLLQGITRAQCIEYCATSVEALMTPSLEQKEDGWHAWVIIT